MAKHLIQAAIAATQVVGRAFVKALRQEIAASQAAAARAGGGTTGAKHAATNTKLGMTLDEAKQILDVKDINDIEAIQKNYEHLFKINDRTNGGTLYLQSKMSLAMLGRPSVHHLSSNTPGTQIASVHSVCANYQLFSNDTSKNCSEISMIQRRSFSTSAVRNDKLTWEEVLSVTNRERCINKLNKMISPRVLKNTDNNTPKSAVLIPLCHVNNELSLLFTVRSNALKSHRGEVSYPGGLADPADVGDVLKTALREAHEEIGLEPSSVDVWGVLPSIPTGPGTVYVAGVLAYIGHIEVSSLILNSDEVSQVFTVTLKELCSRDSFRQTQFRTSTMKGGSYTIPVYTGDHPRVWGFTAIVTHMTLRALLPGLYTHNLRHLPMLQ